MWSLSGIYHEVPVYMRVRKKYINSGWICMKDLSNYVGISGVKLESSMITETNVPSSKSKVSGEWESDCASNQ